MHKRLMLAIVLSGMYKSIMYRTVNDLEGSSVDDEKWYIRVLILTVQQGKYAKEGLQSVVHEF